MVTKYAGAGFGFDRRNKKVSLGAFSFVIANLRSCCRLYEKLAVNSRNDDLIIDGAKNEIDSEGELGSEQPHVEVWKEQVENRIGASAFQHASQLLEAVTRTLDGLEDGLVKHAEVFLAVTFYKYDHLCLNE